MDEFQKWKKWSDGDYENVERKGRGFYDNITFDEKLDIIGAVASIEDQLVGQMDEQIKSCVTEKQYYRLWMLHVKKMTIKAIAAHESVTHQSISESISAARKNIFVFLQNALLCPVFVNRGEVKNRAECEHPKSAA